MMIKTGNVHDGTQLRHVHRYVTTYNQWGLPVGRRCPCGLYQSGVDPRHALYSSFTYDDY